MGRGHQIRGTRCPMTASLRPAEPGALEGRLATLVEAYDRQGLHRSATDVDQQSAEWLLDCARGLGVQATLEPFAIDRVDPQPSFLRIAGRRIDGVPLF